MFLTQYRDYKWTGVFISASMSHCTFDLYNSVKTVYRMFRESLGINFKFIQNCNNVIKKDVETWSILIFGIAVNAVNLIPPVSRDYFNPQDIQDIVYCKRNLHLHCAWQLKVNLVMAERGFIKSNMDESIDLIGGNEINNYWWFWFNQELSIHRPRKQLQTNGVPTYQTSTPL